MTAKSKESAQAVDIPEKKKRIPKPKVTPETTWILQYLMSFLMLNPAKAKDEEIASHAAKVFLGIDGHNVKTEKYFVKNVKSKEDIDSICETLENLQKMVQVFYGYTKGDSKLETWIVRALAAGVPEEDYIISWRSFNDCGNKIYTSVSDYTIRGLIKTLTNRAVRAIISEFQHGKSKKTKIFIGCCPRCKKIFGKDNSKQTWCSNSCRGNQNAPIKK